MNTKHNLVGTLMYVACLCPNLVPFLNGSGHMRGVFDESNTSRGAGHRWGIGGPHIERSLMRQTQVERIAWLQ